MSFDFAQQRTEKIEKKKVLFRNYVKDFLYDNIAQRILLFVADGYKDIKKDLKTQLEYHNYMKENDFNDYDESDNDSDDEKYDNDGGYVNYDGYDEVKNPKNIMVYQKFMKRLVDHYTMVIQTESITNLWDLVGLFIDCSSLFTNRPIEKIGAYCYSSSKYTGLTPSFIKFDHMYHDIIVNFIQLDQQLDLSFDISLMDKNDSAFCKIIRMLLINLVSKIYEWVQNPLLFDGKYFVINGKKPRCIFNGTHLFFQMYFILKK